MGGLLALFLVWWAIGFVQYVRIRVPPAGALDVYVTAKQWMWTFGYVGGGQSLATLYVPAGQPVKLILTSRDVIHSFFVPDFRIKQDVIPGRYTTLWFTAKIPGTHRIFCTEYCGTNHSTMRGEVVVLSAEDHERWLDAGRAPSPPAGQRYVEPASIDELGTPEQIRLVEVGRRAAAEHGCLRCHTLDGTPHIGPTWAGLYLSTVPIAGGATVVADEKYITESMMDPLARIHAGFPAVMPSFIGRIQPAEVAGIVELIRSLRSQP